MWTMSCVKFSYNVHLHKIYNAINFLHTKNFVCEIFSNYGATNTTIDLEIFTVHKFSADATKMKDIKIFQ